MEKYSREEYDSKYAESRTWTCTLSDGTLCTLKDGGSDKCVTFDERLEYCEMVKKVRMSESDKQVYFL